MAYSLKRVSDNVGASGDISECVNSGLKDCGPRPQVGLWMRVGSAYRSSHPERDWWQSGEISEILEESDRAVRFKTKSGSEYVWEES